MLSIALKKLEFVNFEFDCSRRDAVVTALIEAAHVAAELAKNELILEALELGKSDLAEIESSITRDAIKARALEKLPDDRITRAVHDAKTTLPACDKCIIDETITELTAENDRVSAVLRRVGADAQLSARRTERRPEAELAALENRYLKAVRVIGPYPNALDYSALRVMEARAGKLREKIATFGN